MTDRLKQEQTIQKQKKKKNKNATTISNLQILATLARTTTAAPLDSL